MSCHRPHLPSRRAKLTRKASHTMCASCHRKEVKKIRALAHKHPRVQTRCSSCHRPHKSRHPKLLRRQKKNLCLHCHKDRRRNPKHLVSFHKPVGQDCGKCHKSHGSNHPGLLTKPAQQQCMSCHKKVMTTHKATRSAHTSSACLKCHQPHRSRHPKLQRKSQVKLCLTCHNRSIRTQNGRVIKDIKAWLQQPHVHKPVREGKCSQCHQPHQSKQQMLLKYPLSFSFYVPFAKKSYKSCFKCHSPKMVTKKQTRKHTRFRNGALNLHFVHVNKARRGRNCLVCHDTHASRQPALIRSTVPYAKGAWKLPIRFTKQTNGGTCTSGCHKPKSYQRTTPLRTTPLRKGN